MIASPLRRLFAGGCDADVAIDGYAPRDHAARLAASEGRERGDRYRPLHPDPEAVAPVAGPHDSRFDVVVPVHTAYEDVARCLGSLLAAACRTSFALVVVDDASADPRTRALLDRLHRRGQVTLLRNAANLGFVASVNRGIGLHPRRDVVLLNADTCVFDGWLDRLAAVLDADADVGTATPFSNAATILSYPFRLKENRAGLECSAAALDALLARLRLAPVAIPTAVGFCMAIRRACLDAVGSLDAESFGLGYGEENDFCLRATRAGWRHLAATDLFVWHRGGSSFGRRRAALVGQAQRTLERLHPGYAAEIAAFNRRDPLRPARESIDAARVAGRGMVLRRLAPTRAHPTVPEAGVLAAIDDLAPYAGALRLLGGPAMPVPNLPRLVAAMPVPALAGVLARLDLRAVEVADECDAWGERLAAAARLAGVPVRGVAQ